MNDEVVSFLFQIETFRQDYFEYERRSGNLKSVQTSFSSRDLAKENCKHCRRIIKSQEDLRNEQRGVQLENEVLEWLNETYSTTPKAKLWGERMQRLAHKLKKPGGEERLRQKIRNYLKRVPSQISECDEDRREFRELLPDNIINKLKKMYHKPEKRKHSSPVRIFRIEVPKYESNCKIQADFLKCSIDNWLKEIPLKKKYFLDRSIRREDVAQSVVNKLEPFILNRQNFAKDYRRTLKSVILDILNEMPLEIEEYDKTLYLPELAASLVSDLSMETTNYDIYDSMDRKQVKQIKDIKSFVDNEIVNVMKKLHLSISTKRLALIEEELKDAFTTISKSSFPIFDFDNNAFKENIYIILRNLGGLSGYQANYFTDIMLKHFKEFFYEKRRNKENNENLCRFGSLSGFPHNATKSVFHNKSKIRTSIFRAQNLKINENFQQDNSVVEQLKDKIGKWLQSLKVSSSFKKGERDRAVMDLAEDIIDRSNYLRLNPKNIETEENELQYLKYQIFKWFNKMAGESTLAIVENAEELKKRIQSVIKDFFTDSIESNIDTTPIKTETDLLHNNNGNAFLALKYVIISWLEEMPIDIGNKDALAMDLVRNVERNVHNHKDIGTVVDEWATKVIKGKKKTSIEILKAKVGEILTSNYLHGKQKREKFHIRKYEDIIDDWIDSVFLEMYGEILDYKDKNENIHSLAVTIFKMLDHTTTDVEQKLSNIVMQWLNTLTSSEWLGKLPLCISSDEDHVQNKYVRKLIHNLLNNSQIAVNDSLIQSQNKNEFQTDESISSTHKNTIELIAEVHDHNSNKKDRIQDIINPSNVAVYGVRLSSSNLNDGKPNSTETRTKQINENSNEASEQLYFKQLVQQIDDWLSSLNIPHIHDKGFREIVVNDLAGDIIDRRKYMELNPSSKGSDENEMEQLRYQIFKWINKLVGENQHETVKHAPQLMNRIQSIPIPTLLKSSQNKGASTSHLSKSNNKIYVANKSETVLNANNSATNKMGDIATVRSKTGTSPSSVRLSSPLGYRTGPMANTQNVNQVLATSTNIPGRATSAGPNTLCELCTHFEETGNAIPPGKGLNEVYQHFDHIFKQQIQDIPLETPTPEQEMLADLARKGMYNGIWKTYFQLKANPDIENDYSYFELLFEEHIDEMLDCLPQTEEMQNLRPAWKSKLVSDVMTMLKYEHGITDTPSFRQLIELKLDRKFVKEQYQESSNLHQHEFVVRTADAYILYSKYKEEDPTKASIYRQRLMKRVEELAESIKNQHNVHFGYINQAQLCQLAIQVLESVPIPQGEMLQKEVDEILVGEEIEQWYNALPVAPAQNETDEILRKRMRELLAKKLCELEKGDGIDNSSTEPYMKHEVSKFLHERAGLQPNEDLNINFMVEELTNRLKTRKQKSVLDYEEFEKDKPISSTFVQSDPGDALAPLIDIGVEDQIHRTSLPHTQNMHMEEMAGTSGQAYRPSLTSPSHGQGFRFSKDDNQTLSDLRHVPGETADMSFVRTTGLCQQRSEVPHMIDRSLVSVHGIPESQPSCQVGQGLSMSTARQPQVAFGQAHLSASQPGPSPDFVNPTGAMTSTARVASPADEEVIEELDEEMGEVRYKCRCMERVWRCKRRRFCDDLAGPPRCYPMPFPCRYYY